MARKIKGIEVKSCEKVKGYYVFIINVVWSDGDFRTIFRRYNQFYDLQMTLLEKFPREAGYWKGHARIIPYIPGKEIFRSKEKIAKKRVAPLDEYCKELMHLPDHISKCLEVVSFFRHTQEDVKKIECKNKEEKQPPIGEEISGPMQLEVYIVLQDFENEGPDEVSMTTGELVSVLDKDESGWWLVETKDGRGYAPSTLLEKQGQATSDVITFEPGKEETYICTENHVPMFDDEIKLKLGAQVKVVEKWMNGWWVVRHVDKVGKVPGQKLAPARPNIVQHGLKFAKQTARDVDINEDEDYTDYEIVFPRAGSPPVIREREDDAPVPLSSDVQTDNVPQWKRRISRRDNRTPPRLGSLTKDRVPPAKLKRKKKSGPGKEPPDRGVDDEDIATYIAREAYNTPGGGLCFQPGDVVQVVEKCKPQWWFVSFGGEDGMVPSRFLQEKRQEPDSNSQHPALPSRDWANKPTEPSENIPLWKKSHSPKDNTPQGETYAVTNKDNTPQGETYAVTNKVKPPTSPKPQIHKPPTLHQPRPDNPQHNQPTANSNLKTKPVPAIPSTSAGATSATAFPARSKFGSVGSTDNSCSESEEELELYVEMDGFNYNKQIHYNVLYDYDAFNNTDITIRQGQIVELVDSTKESTGWWQVRLGKKRGWVPKHFLEPAQPNSPRIDDAPLRPPPLPKRNNDVPTEGQARKPMPAQRGATPGRAPGLDSPNLMSELRHRFDR